MISICSTGNTSQQSMNMKIGFPIFLIFNVAFYISRFSGCDGLNVFETEFWSPQTEKAWIVWLLYKRWGGIIDWVGFNINDIWFPRKTIHLKFT